MTHHETYEYLGTGWQLSIKELHKAQIDDDFSNLEVN